MAGALQEARGEVAQRDHRHHGGGPALEQAQHQQAHDATPLPSSALQPLLTHRK